ncbi:ethanolamine ammonia-lyase light chain EutC, partial [Rhodopseudomonas sp. BAL398]|uniref:ethanolamine ammonia-lyase light chain EutC n=1 Tax=Rhodopseudomonas sp. BAL398 TaxID=3034676 RepID=UPI0023E1F634
MTPSPHSPRSLSDLRRLTPARVALGRVGVSLPTKALLDFTLAHARARDAVHAEFDSSGIAAGLEALGLTALPVASRAVGRKDYLARPDLGRQLDPASRDAVAAGAGGCDLALMIGDGLSPVAVNSHGLEMVRHLLPRLAGIGVGAVAVATRAPGGVGGSTARAWSKLTPPPAERRPAPATPNIRRA